MAEESGISWTKSTFNPWIGCTKIGPGCDACYAETLDKNRLSKTLGGGTAEKPIIHWGHGAPRHRTSIQNWNSPIKWNRQAPDSEFAERKGFWPVFCASLADVFDNEVDPLWRMDLFKLLQDTPNLSWLLVTKRIGNVSNMMPQGWRANGFPPNVRLLITVVNQEEADRDIPKLLALPVKNGVSYEPALERVNWRPWLGAQCDNGSVPGPGGVGGRACPRCMGANGSSKTSLGCPGLEWIIVGGESSQGAHKARPFDLGWAHATVNACQEYGVPAFVKQLGSNPYGAGLAGRLKDRTGADPEEWPNGLNVQEFPA